MLLVGLFQSVTTRRLIESRCSGLERHAAVIISQLLEPSTWAAGVEMVESEAHTLHHITSSILSEVLARKSHQHGKYANIFKRRKQLGQVARVYARQPNAFHRIH